MTRSAYHGYDTDVFGGIPPLTVRSFVGRGRVTPDETIEQIKATYALNGNARETSRVLNVPFSTVRKHITTDEQDEFAQVRSEKMAEAIPSVIDQARLVQLDLLRAMRDPQKIADARLNEIFVAFGIITDKIQLLTGEATERHEHRDTSAARDLLVSRVDELAARRRSRGDSERSLGATGT